MEEAALMLIIIWAIIKCFSDILLRIFAFKQAVADPHIVTRFLMAGPIKRRQRPGGGTSVLDQRGRALEKQRENKPDFIYLLNMKPLIHCLE